MKEANMEQLSMVPGDESSIWPQQGVTYGEVRSEILNAINEALGEAEQTMRRQLTVAGESDRREILKDYADTIMKLSNALAKQKP